MRMDLAEFKEGFVRHLPIGIFIGAFGMAFGLASLQQGLSVPLTIGMSATVYAGAAQFAALDFWQTPFPIVPLLLAVFLINARHLLLGAAIYPHIAHLPPIKRYTSVAFISDINWLLATERFESGRSGFGMLVGGGIALWVCWFIGTILGVYFGNLIANPKAFGLDLVMVCFLLAMVMGGKKDGRLSVIWCVAAIASLLAYYFLPKNSHVLVGAIIGGVLGALWHDKPKNAQGA